MRIANSMVAAGFIAVFGSARADSSLIPSNYVDDFGSLLPSGQTVAPTASSNAHASLIPSNYVDDFGTDPSAPSEVTATARADHPTPNSEAHHEEEAGSGGGEPQRGDPERDTDSQFLQGIWSAP